ncbi:ryanodine-inositol 1,4,5-triphosphate receptor Ca2 channel (RIR-CaC) family protein [Thraustotheca clavata]|uniref:Ryanodine-inositol 1,4,5-triphosphate receptor Ca2 channel (RIR-CaC) family protein n=1 Tax=Thraustotheca clavata TaxID=74557 RepID=A0A1V9ZAA8_9STRA|nr:ryanodine-inositol 1,4,5-triphosphate receptor Ca2 channel (RIR-CaC) family protein [Thraustotheca clavata]
MQRFKSKRERRNLNVDATLTAQSPISPSNSLARPIEIYAPSPPPTPGANGLLSPRNLPATLDRLPVEYHTAKSSSPGFLLYGMVISCLSMDRGGLLATDGLITQQVRLESLLQSLKTTVDLVDQQLTDPGSQRDVQVVGCHTKDCLFEVVPKMAYEATTLFAKKSKDTNVTSTTSFFDAMSDLKFKSESEQRLNMNIYQKLHGTRVKYGQTIQLRHIKSGKYISAMPTRDKDNMDIVSSEGNASCHFVLLPRFKLRKAGEPVQLMDQVVLALINKSQKYMLRVSNRLAVDGTSPLIESSTAHSSQWRLVPYEHLEKEHLDGLKSGKCIRLLHLESNSWLSYQDTIQLQSEGTDHNDGRSPLLAPDTLWEVEKSCFLQGGLLHWTDSICLRHVMSGSYLQVDSALQVIARATPESFALRPTTLVNPRFPIGLKSAVLIQHLSTQSYIHIQSLMHHVGTSLEPQDEDAFKLVPVAHAELQDTLRLLAYRALFESFIAGFEVPMTQNKLHYVEHVLSELNTFTFHDTQTPDHVLWMRQTLLQRHQFVLLLRKMLQAPFTLYNGPFTIEYVCSFDDQANEPNPVGSPIYRRKVSTARIDTNLPIEFQWNEETMKTLHRVLCGINILLFRIFYSSKTTDTSACRYAMPILLKLLGHGLKASVPLSYLIQEKFHLSESFASYSSIIRNFLDLIKSQGKAIRYLQFLVVLCSANGHAVPKVQEKICELIFNPSHGYTDSVLVQTRPTADGLQVLVDSDEWIPLGQFYDDFYDMQLRPTLVPYFYGLLQLYCALCMDRNYTCIRWLTASFPRTSLLACVKDSQLSRSIRAVLLNLLVVLHLDCEPQTPIASPNYTRIWREVLQTKDYLPVASEQLYSPDDWIFFDMLQHLIMNYFHKLQGVLIITESPQNDLTLAVVRLCKKMVEFGLFRTIDQLSGLVTELVKLLDPRSDYWYPPKSKSHQSLKEMTEKTAPIVVTPTFFHRSSESTRFDLKAQNAIIQQAESDNTTLDEVFRRESIERQFSKDKKQKLKDDDVHRVRRRSANLPRLMGGSSRVKEPQVKMKFKMNEFNHVIMEIKDNICAILLHIDTLRLDSQISTVLMTLASEPPSKKNAPRWRRHHKLPMDSISPLSRAMFETSNLDCRLSLSVLAHRPIDTILLQTLMYEHPPLVSKALELLMQQFNQHDQLFKALSNVLLLVNEATVDIYGELKEDVQKLRRIAETTEVWMNLVSNEDFEVANSVVQVLTSFTSLLPTHTEHRKVTNLTTPIRISSILDWRTRRNSATASIDNQLPLHVVRVCQESDKKGETTQVEVRRLLRNLDAMQTVLGLLRDGHHFFRRHFPSILGDSHRLHSPQSGNEKQIQCLRQVFVTCMQFLNAFAINNIMNQSLLAEHVSIILDFIEELDEAQMLLKTIYTSNLALCKCMPVKVLLYFLELWNSEMKSCGLPKPRYIHALDAFVLCENQPITENQHFVLLELFKPEDIALYCHYFYSDHDAFYQLVLDCKSTMEQLPLVIYHIDLLHLLASCAMGNEGSHHDLCASLLSYNATVSILERCVPLCVGPLHEHQWLNDLLMALIRFLYIVHLSAETRQPELESQLLPILSSLVIEYTFAHICNLQQIDAISTSPPQPHVVYDGGRMWVDVLAKSYINLLGTHPKCDYYCTMLLTWIVPALYLCLQDTSQISVGVHQALYVLLNTSITASTFTPLTEVEQGALLAVVRMFDKLVSVTKDPTALEVLTCEVSIRPKRPFLGSNRVLRLVILGESNACDTLAALYDQLLHPDLASSPSRASFRRPSKDYKALHLNSSKSSPTNLVVLKPSEPLKASPTQPKYIDKSPLWVRICKYWRSLLPKQQQANQTKYQHAEVHDGTVLDAFLTFVREDPRTNITMVAELNAMMQRILHLEQVLKEEADTYNDIPKTPLTFDDVVLKLIEHFKLLKHAKYFKMSVILLEVFCQMIKSLESHKRHSMQQKLDQLGLTVLVVNIISTTGDTTVLDRCIELGIALLDGMNAKVQEHFYAIWSETKSIKFFERIKHRMDRAAEEIKSESSHFPQDELPRHHSMILRLKQESKHPNGMEKQYSSIINIFRFLQLLCEGHFLSAQRYLISQSSVSINLVEATTSFLLDIHSSLNSSTILLFKQLFDTITEFCQGPCLEAQECVANYKFFSMVNELMVVAPCEDDFALKNIRLLKASIFITLLSLIEGRTDSIIHDRLVTELNFDTIKDNLVDVYRYFESTYKGVYDGHTLCSCDHFLSMGFNIHILIQHLMEHQPQLASTLLPKQSTYHQLQVERSFTLLRYEAFTRWLKQSQTQELIASSFDQKELAYTQAYTFFDSKCGRVEIVWNLNNAPHLMQVYFPIHPICFCITERSKHRLKTTIDFDPSTKLTTFFAQTSTLLHEMEYQSQLQQSYLLSLMTSQTHHLQVLSFTLALVINVINLFSIRADTAFTEPYFGWDYESSDGIPMLIIFLGTCQIILCTLVFVLYAIHTAPLLITEGWHAEKRKIRNALNGTTQLNDFDTTESLQDVEDLIRLLGDRDEFVILSGKDKLRNAILSIRFLLIDPLLVYYTLLILISVLGTYYHPLYFSFHVLDIINRSQELKNVLRAIVIPGKSLLLIFALYLLLVYIFATIGFYYFRPDYTTDAASNPNATYRCKSLFLCFLSSFDQAFKANGGLGGFLAPRSLGNDPLATGRYLFDNLYNIILMIILLNITFGIIIDTFATIRTSHKERIEELRDRCFICSIDGYTFDRLTKRGFEYHTHFEHNMWHYLYLFVHINKKDYTEYNGVELYLAMKMAKNDVSFFPNHRAMALEKLPANFTDHEEVAIESKKSIVAPLAVNEIKRNNSDRKLLESPTKAEPTRLEKQMEMLFEQQTVMREKQRAMEDLQRQMLSTQQTILQLLQSNEPNISPVKTHRKSEHFFPE